MALKVLCVLTAAANNLQQATKGTMSQAGVSNVRHRTDKAKINDALCVKAEAPVLSIDLFTL